MALTSSQIASRLFKQSLTTAETATSLGYNEEPISSRLSVFPSQIWVQSDQIPSTANPSLKANALTPGSSYSVGVVKYFRKHTLKTFSGTSNKDISFWSEDLIDAIPLNFDPSGASYVFELFRSDGTTPINFGNGDWLVDTNAGVLTFYGTTSPAGIVSSSNPPKISFYKYIGTKGLGVDSGIGTILGVTAGVGLTGGGTAGYITLDVNVGNGLEVSSDTIYLGGTLSQQTNIQMSGNTFSIVNGATGISLFMYENTTYGSGGGFTLGDISNTNTIDLLGIVENYGIVIRSYEKQVSLGSNVNGGSNSHSLTIYPGSQSISDGSDNNHMIINDYGGKGLVYYGDYTPNFTTHSLVTKGYVDSAVPNVGAGNGLQELSPAVVGLGGTLSQNTTINSESLDFTIQNFGILSLTGSIVDVQLENGTFLVDVDSGGSIDLYGGDVTLFATGSVDIISTDEFTVSTEIGYITTASLEGLVYTSDYSGTFVTNSLVTKGYVDSIASSIGTDNGLSEFSPGIIGLGGTLSQNTIINSDGFDLTIGSVDTLLFTSSIFDVESDFISLDAGTGSVQVIANGDIDIMSISEISLGGNSGRVTTSNNQGLVYTSDYTSTFVTNSLVTKGYVDSIASSIDVILSADNGLSEFSPGTVSLGGSLSQNTLIDVDGNTFSFLDTTGTFSSFFTMATNSIYGKTIEMGLSEDLTNSASSSYISFSEDNGTILQDYNKQVQMVTNVPFGSYVFKITAGSQSIGDGSTDNHMIIDDYGSKGLVYQDDYTLNFTQNSLVTKSFVVDYINTTHFSQDFSVPSNTSGDGASTFQSILYTPFDSSSVQVFVNGLLQRLGDGVTASVDCYFSADGGLTPLGIDGVSSGDILYWNGLTSRFDLETDDEVSIVYQYKP
jgi:hypothetical protein